MQSQCGPPAHDVWHDGHPDGMQSHTGPPAHDVSQVAHGSQLPAQVSSFSVFSPPRTVPGPACGWDVVVNDSTASSSSSSRSLCIASSMVLEEESRGRAR